MGLFKSSTQEIPPTTAVPRHIAVIMDGNGRWAKQRFMPRIAGHKRGVETVREVVKACAERGVEFLTLFAFSSENWRRPQEEVSFLMELFLRALEREVEKLNNNQIKLRVIGNRERFDLRIQELIISAEEKTRFNTGLTLTICADYGGRWDILQATRQMLQQKPDLIAAGFAEEDLTPFLAMNYAPEPDLFIRTGGEQRISNFLLWQLAYTELYFTETLWPDFDRDALGSAIDWYQQRERRFGRTSEQLTKSC